MTYLTQKFIPFTGGRYTVNETSDIYFEGELVESIIIGNTEYINIDWYDGKRLYEKALVLLAVFDYIQFPDHFYRYIKVIYRDGNTRNCFLSNLTYVFKEPLETTVPGFYYIPMFPDYGVNHNGDVIVLKTQVFKAWTPTKGNKDKNQTPGYDYAVLYNSNTKVTYYKHRLLCLVFKQLPDKIFGKLTVNHKDGNKFNSTLENLEWCTYAENNQHAWDNGLKQLNKERVLVRNLVTNKILVFPSIRKCASYFGGNSGFYISKRISERNNKVYPDLLQFKMDDGSNWPEVDSSQIPNKEKSFINTFLARNVFTGAITIFSNASESIELFNIEPEVVLNHARNNVLIPYKGYNFRFLSQSETFPEHTKRHLEIYKAFPLQPGNGLIVLDVQTNKEDFFVSLDQAIEKLETKETTIKNYIGQNVLFKDRYKLTLFKLKEELISDNKK